MDSTALAPRGLASGTVGKLAGMVRICSIGLIGSQGLSMIYIIYETAVHRLNGGGRSISNITPFKIESVPPERVLHEETV